jgi:23S rRNA U2552 (ribose-2'-O)-methylase RlmE/FtsJ
MDTGEQNAPPWVKCKFQPGQHCKSTLFTYVPWQISNENEEVQHYKLEIAKYEEGHIWELAKKMVNPYEFIHTQDDSQFHSSLCVLKPLSRSYFKMIEMLSLLDFFRQIPKQVSKLRSAHVAEGPGGFIEAFYEACEYEKRIISNVTAMTLKPTSNNVPGWRRASIFLQKHPEIKLHYGIDGTGDIYQKGNQDSFVQTAKHSVHLFTADGGFDFSIDYEDQEKRVFHLLVCSAIIGLRVLGTGGCFVLKIFDINAEHTRILICLLGRCFKEWALYKPATSRPCNSERYFLGKGFRGINPAILETLNTIQNQSLLQRYPISPNFITESEKSYIESHSQELLQNQCAFLKRGIEYIHTPSLWKTHVEDNFKKSLHWCSHFHVPVLQRKLNSAAIEAVVSQMSERVAAQQLQKLDAEKESPRPSDPTSQAS